MKCSVPLCLALGLFSWTASPSLAFFEGNDVAPRVEDGKIVNDAWGHESGEIDYLNQRVFSWDAHPFISDFFSDPGFNARVVDDFPGYPGHGFPTNARFGAQFIDELLFWDGNGEVNLQPATTQHAEIEFGPWTVTVDGTGVTSDEDMIFWGTSSGPTNVGPHEHLSTSILGTDTAGIFVVTMKSVTDAVGIEDSDPVFVVFNNGGAALDAAQMEAFAFLGADVTGDYNGDGVVDVADYSVWRSTYGSDDLRADGNDDGFVDAADYTIWRDNLSPSVASLLVPEPMSFGLLTMGGVAIGLRRRRK